MGFSVGTACQTNEELVEDGVVSAQPTVAVARCLKDEVPTVTEGADERPECEPEQAEHDWSYNRAMEAGSLLCS